MKLQDIYNILDKISPFNIQAPWDNSGLNLGNMQNNINNIYVTLEINYEMIANLQDRNALFITHHPLIFAPIKHITTNLYPCNIIQECIKKDISIIAMHTNFDITHLNQAFVKRMQLESLGLQYKDSKEYSLIYSSTKHINIESLAKHVAKMLQMQHLRYAKGSDHILEVFITSGSNAQSYKIANPNTCIITGDIKYHDAMIANSNGISFIDVGHFESECIFGNIISDVLQKYNIQAIIANPRNPFIYV